MKNENQMKNLKSLKNVVLFWKKEVLRKKRDNHPMLCGWGQGDERWQSDHVTEISPDVSMLA